MKKTILYLVRHGQTSFNKNFRFMGQKDVPLNRTGIYEANSLKEYFKGVPIDVIYASSLIRAYKTASIINKCHKLPITKVPQIKEIDFGKWEGLNYKKITRYSGEIFAKWIENPFSVNIPGGENMRKFAARVTKAIKKIIKENKGKTILVVSHGGTLRAVLTKIFGIKKNFIKLEQASGTINLIELNGKSFKIKLVNYTKHIQKD